MLETLLKEETENITTVKKKKENITTVWFNAWQYQNEEDIFFPFMATIFNEINKTGL